MRQWPGATNNRPFRSIIVILFSCNKDNITFPSSVESMPSIESLAIAILLFSKAVSKFLTVISVPGFPIDPSRIISISVDNSPPLKIVDRYTDLPDPIGFASSTSKYEFGSID